MIPLDPLDKFLHQANLRLTRPRRVVFEFFSIAGEPIQLPQILRALSGVIDRASVYRTISLFLDLGVLQEVHRPGKQWLELGDFFTNTHHHHITCNKCGHSQTLTNPALEQTLTAVAEQVGFQPTGHHLEINGLCPICLAAGRDQ